MDSFCVIALAAGLVLSLFIVVPILMRSSQISRLEEEANRRQ